MARHTRDTPAYYLSRRELRLCDDSTPEQREAGYQRWRATVPWTTEEIVTALREIAGAESSDFLKHRWNFYANYVERTGKFSAMVLSMALPILIKKCALCGKTALYRLANEGRCREHKMVPAESAQERRRRIDLGSADISESNKNFDKRQMDRLRFANPRYRRGGHK
jgi:hypothetical protein